MGSTEHVSELDTFELVDSEDRSSAACIWQTPVLSANTADGECHAQPEEDHTYYSLFRVQNLVRNFAHEGYF